MTVSPRSGLQVQISEKGLIYVIDALDVLRMLHHHVRRTVIGFWFDHGYMRRLSFSATRPSRPDGPL